MVQKKIKEAYFNDVLTIIWQGGIKGFVLGILMVLSGRFPDTKPLENLKFIIKKILLSNDGKIESIEFQNLGVLTFGAINKKVSWYINSRDNIFKKKIEDIKDISDATEGKKIEELFDFTASKSRYLRKQVEEEFFKEYDKFDAKNKVVFLKLLNSIEGAFLYKGAFLTYFIKAF